MTDFTPAIRNVSFKVPTTLSDQTVTFAGGGVCVGAFFTYVSLDVVADGNDEDSRGIGHGAFSFNAGVPQQWSDFSIRKSAVAGPEGFSIYVNNKVITMLDDAGVIIAQAIVKGLVTDGFELTWEIVDGANYEITAELAFDGPTAMCEAGTVSVVSSAVPIVPGFSPQMVKFSSTGPAADDNAVNAGHQISLGVAGRNSDAVIHQACYGDKENDNPAGLSDTFDIVHNDRCCTGVNTAGPTSPGNGIVLQSFDVNGFTVAPAPTFSGLIAGYWAVSLRGMTDLSEEAAFESFDDLADDNTAVGAGLDHDFDSDPDISGGHWMIGGTYSAVVNLTANNSDQAGTMSCASGDFDNPTNDRAFCLYGTDQGQTPQKAGVSASAGQQVYRLLQPEAPGGSPFACLFDTILADTPGAGGTRAHQTRGGIGTFDHVYFLGLLQFPALAQLETLVPAVIEGSGRLEGFIGFNRPNVIDVAQLWNEASTKLGGPRILSITDKSREAQILSDNWNPWRRAFLQMHTWNGAHLTDVQLDRATNQIVEMPSRWAEAYFVPSYCLEITRIHAPTNQPDDHDWEVGTAFQRADLDDGKGLRDIPRRVIFTAEQIDNFQMKIDVGDDIGELKPMTLQALCAWLAFNLAVSFGRTDLLPVMEQYFDRIVAMARSHDGQEGKPQLRTGGTELVDARLLRTGGGGSATVPRRGFL